MVIFCGLGWGIMGIFRTSRGTCLAITDPVQVRPQKSEPESWKSTSTTGAGGGGAWSSTKTGAGGGGAWSSTKTGGAWSSSGAVGGGAWSSTKTEGAWSSTKTGGAWSSSAALGGGSWASSERPVAPAWPSRTPYKSVPQRPEPESRKQTSHRVSFDLSSQSTSKSKPPPYRHVEPSPTPEVRQVTAFPSVWSPSTARKVTKKN